VNMPEAEGATAPLSPLLQANRKNGHDSNNKTTTLFLSSSSYFTSSVSKGYVHLVARIDDDSRPSGIVAVVIC